MSCTSTLKNQVKKNHTHYGLKAPSHWLQKSFKGADLFYEHQSQLADIYVNAECDKFSDSDLEVLTSQLLVGLSNINYVKQERIPIAAREALVSEVTARVDGVDRFLKTMVFRKNRCIYDMVFSSALSASYLAADFDIFIKNFWAEADL